MKLDLGMSAEEFLREYWQKKPLLIRNALPHFLCPISPDELAGLACEESIESRIIQEIGKTPWQLMRGPFTDKVFKRLPETKWTLLVQAVDHVDENIHALKQLFRFIPDWQIDDVMISYAPKGGSVGPHYDNYDVFLIQGQGQREWTIGGLCDDDSPLLPHSDLRLLADFQPEDSWVLNPGDILYLPPRIAHWGIALNECMTLSVGFRAPAITELLANYCDELLGELSANQRFHYTETYIQEHPAEITPETVAAAKRNLLRVIDNDDIFTQWLGKHLSEPKYPELWQDPEEDGHVSLDKIEVDDRQLWVCPGSRLNYIKSKNKLHLFANGEAYGLPHSALDWITKLTECESITISTLGADDASRSCVDALLARGVLYAEGEE